MASLARAVSAAGSHWRKVCTGGVLFSGAVLGVGCVTTTRRSAGSGS